MLISKSDYMLYLKHPAWLWLKKNNPSKIPPVDEATQAMFDAGHAFEPYVESLFSDGVSLGFSDFESYRTLPARTQQALESGEKVIFQPRFEFGKFTCISDIVLVVEDKIVDLYEIKSSTSVKPEHLYDLAFQKVVLEGNGLDVRRVYVIHVNNQYVRHGDIIAKELTVLEDVTEKVNELAIKTPGCMQAASETIRQSSMPDPDPALAKLGSKADWLKIYENIFPPEEKIWPPDTHPTIDSAEINRFLAGLKYPLYFFDYETFQGLIPYFDGQRPYQQVPFQYSLHILRTPDGKIEHREYLHKDSSNPVEAIAKQLIDDVSDSGSIIAWNMQFEKSVNDELGRMLPELSEKITAINERVVDLMEPFKKKAYDDPRFEGSASIKKVLPVVCPHLSYKDLGIQEGSAAQRLWTEAVLKDTKPEEKDIILENLLDYCKLDTLAMVEIFNVLRRL